MRSHMRPPKDVRSKIVVGAPDPTVTVTLAAPVALFVIVIAVPATERIAVPMGMLVPLRLMPATSAAAGIVPAVHVRVGLPLTVVPVKVPGYCTKFVPSQLA